MAWRLAKSLEVLRKQVNEAYPNRRKASDGTIGDDDHANRDSDHNPWVQFGGLGIVTAVDFTHDPQGGLVARKLAEALIASRDSRIKYVISNRQICSGSAGPSPWKWRAYNGKNPHTQHMHLSVRATPNFFDETDKWKISFPKPKAAPSVEDKPIVKSKIATGAGTVVVAESADLGLQVNDAIEKAGQAKQVGDTFGLWEKLEPLTHNPRFWIAVAVIVIGLGIIYWRWRDHGRGSEK